MEQKIPLDLRTLKMFAAKTTPILARVDVSLKQATMEFQRRFIALAILKADCNMMRAAHLMGVDRANLYRKIQQLGFVIIKPEDPKFNEADFYDTDVAGGI